MPFFFDSYLIIFRLTLFCFIIIIVVVVATVVIVIRIHTDVAVAIVLVPDAPILAELVLLLPHDCLATATCVSSIFNRGTVANYEERGGGVG